MRIKIPPPLPLLSLHSSQIPLCSFSRLFEQPSPPHSSTLLCSLFFFARKKGTNNNNNKKHATFRWPLLTNDALHMYLSIARKISIHPSISLRLLFLLFLSFFFPLSPRSYAVTALVVKGMRRFFFMSVLRPSIFHYDDTQISWWC